MSTARITTALEKTIFFGLVLVLVIPVFSFRLPIAGFLLRQEILFQMLVAVLCALFLLKTLLEKQVFAITKPHAVVWATAFFVAAFGITTLTAVSPLRAFFSTWERLTGWWFLASAFFFFLLLLACLKKREDWMTLFAASVAGSGMSGAYAIGQRFGIFSATVNLSDQRLYGAFGNPSFFAAYLLLNIFLALFLFSMRIYADKESASISPHQGESASSKNQRLYQPYIYVYPAIIALNAFALILTATRGALLGLYGGLLAAASLFLMYQRTSALSASMLRKLSIDPGGIEGSISVSKNQHQSALDAKLSHGAGQHKSAKISTNQHLRKIARAGLIFLVVAPILIFGLSKAFPQNYYLSRLTDPVSLVETGFRNRLIVWRASIEMFQERPLSGWGIENFAYGFDAHFNPALLERVRAQEAWFDRSHNIFLDSLVAGGIIGALAFLLFLGALFWYAFSLRKTYPGSPWLVGLLAAYVIQGGFLFDIFPTYLVLFMLAAFLATPSQEHHAKFLLLPNVFVKLASAGGILVAVWAFYAFLLLPSRAMGYGWKAFEAFPKNQNDFRTLWDRAFELPNPFRPDLWLSFSEFILDRDPSRSSHIQVSLQDLRQSLTAGLDEFKVLQKSHTLEARYFYQAGRLGNLLYSLGGSVDEKETETALMHALALSPVRVDTYYELAEFERQRNNLEGAAAYLEKALLINAHIPQTYFNLAVLRRDQGRLEEAVQAAETALQRGYGAWARNYHEVSFLIDLYLRAGKKDQALVDFYLVAIRLDPKNPQLYGSVAFLLKELGRFDEAAAYARKVADIDPLRATEVEAFLRSLGRQEP